VVPIHEHSIELLASLTFFWHARLHDNDSRSSKSEFSVLKLPEHVRSTHNQDGAVVLDIRQGQIFRLNLVGSRMIELLKQGRAEALIAEEISREFGASRELVATDLREFLTHLEKHHLIELREPETHATL
jgi:hypothetical protein